MLTLCNWHLRKTWYGVVHRASTVDGTFAALMLENEDITTIILSFFGEKRGKGDLRGAGKTTLYAVALEMNAPGKDALRW